MLHIAFTILKIIGIILLAILALIVLLLCIVVFTPLRYQISSEIDGTLDSLKANIKFSWFFHLISGYFIYEEKEAEFQVKFLGRNIDLDKLTEKEDVKSRTEESQEEVKESKEPETTEVSEIPEKVSEKESQSSESEKKSAEKTNKPAADQKKKRKCKPKKQSIWERIKCTIHSACDKIKALKQKIEEIKVFINDEIHRSAFVKTLKEIKRLFRFLKPKKFHMNFTFGFENPAQTGQVLGVISMLYPFFAENMDVTPDFENQVLKGDLYMKGHIRGAYAVILVFNLIRDRNIRTTLKNIKKFMANV